MSPTLPSALTLSLLGLSTKAFLRLACKDFEVRGLDRLVGALREPGEEVKRWKGKEKEVCTPSELDGVLERFPNGKRRGIVTVCNHTSVVDDPMMWGMMPLSTYLPFTPSRVRRTSRNTRWTLGASDIMFTNKLHSKFFTLGQVIETVRGGGIFQPAIDEAIKKLQDGEWIHIFPEGKVSQPTTKPEGGMFRFKWGVSRIIMDSEVMPTVIPIWLSGFEDIMPETRKYLRFFPRPGKKASVTIGEPITHRILPLVDRWKALAGREGGRLGVGGEWDPQRSLSHIPTEKRKELGFSKVVPDAASVVDEAYREQPTRVERWRGRVAGGEEERMRIEICDVLTEEMRRLGVSVEEEEGKAGNAWRNAVRNDGS